MSSASTSRTIKFISKAGTYTAMISSPSGDLYQDWQGTTDNFTVFPDFTSTKPLLYFVCTSSRVAEGKATPDGMSYYFNGELLAFSGDTSTGTYAGFFKKVAPSGDQLYYGLQILKNIAEVSGFAPAVVKMVASISYGTLSDSIQASYTIPVQQATGTAYRVTIQAGDTKAFVINAKDGSCILKAVAYQGTTAISKSLTYKWEKMSAGGWSVLTGKTAATLTVAASDIDTYGEYRVTVSQSGTEIGSDVQGVMDVSDPYDIDPHPSPEDESITEDEGGNGEVTYTPVVVKRGTGTKALDTQFYFVVRDRKSVV